FQRAVRESIAHAHVEPAGVASVAVLAHKRERQAAFRRLLYSPQALVKGCGAAVEVVPAVVLRQAVLPAAQGEARAADAVGAAAHQRAAEARLLTVGPHAVEAQRHVQRPAPRGHHEAAQRAAVVEHFALQPAATQADAEYLAAVWQAPKSSDVLRHCRQLLTVLSL